MDSQTKTSLSLAARTAACWLIALVIFPFSAPLSVCDLGDLVPKTMADGRAPLSNSPIRASVVKDALAQAFPVRASRSLTRRDAPSGGWSSFIAVAPIARRSTSPFLHATLRRSRPVTKTILRI